jgi:hypothetical protein
MSKKQNTTSKKTASRVTEKKGVRVVESYTTNKKATTIVNTHPAPKRPDPKD